MAAVNASELTKNSAEFPRLPGIEWIPIDVLRLNPRNARTHPAPGLQRPLRLHLLSPVKQQLHASGSSGLIEMGPYLSKLCDALSSSMIIDDRQIALKVLGESGNATCRQAERLGLIVTELVINSLKHAFNEVAKEGKITVAYEVSETDWKLSVADNGMGKPDGVFAQPKTGLGTGIVNALAKQLNAQVETLSGSQGTTMSITHATFAAKGNRAA